MFLPRLADSSNNSGMHPSYSFQSHFSLGYTFLQGKACFIHISLRSPLPLNAEINNKTLFKIIQTH